MENKNPFGLPQEFIDFVNDGKTLKWEVFEGYIEEEDTIFLSIDLLKKKVLKYRNFMDEEDPNKGKEGFYPVEYIPLIKDPEAFGWFPQIKCFGQYNSEEGELFAFQGITWNEIIKKETAYLNAIFQLDEASDEIEDYYQYFFTPYENEQFIFVNS